MTRHEGARPFEAAWQERMWITNSRGDSKRCAFEW